MKIKIFFKYLYIYLLCVCLCMHIMAGAWVDARGQPMLVGYLLPTCSTENQIQVYELGRKPLLPAEHFAKLEYRF